MTGLTDDGRVAAKVLDAVLGCVAGEGARAAVAAAIESVARLDAEAAASRRERLDADKAYADGYAAGLAAGFAECRAALEGRRA